MKPIYLKTNRTFTSLKKWSWLFVIIVALGGLWYHKLGLLLLPVMLALPLFGITKGKYWCGNICPHGSLFDLLILPISRNRKIPSWAKSKTTLIVAFCIFMYMLGYRILQILAVWGTASFPDKLGLIFVINYLVVTIIGTLLAFFISPRTWCQFCPMGTFQTIFYRLGTILGINKKTDVRVIMSDSGKCLSCGKCSRVCPMQLQPYRELAKSNHLANNTCIRCFSCIVYCPVNALCPGNIKNPV